MAHTASRWSRGRWLQLCVQIVLACLTLAVRAAAQNTPGYMCTPSGNMCCPRGQTCAETNFPCPKGSLRPSSLYGCKGELMQRDRLPLDWSYAGYMMGEQALPAYSIGVNVKDYGAAGDGVTDDTAAITQAITACPDGASVFLPAGRYVVTQRIVIRNRPISLAGEGPDSTTIYLPSSLSDVYGNTPMPDGSSQYSHQDAFIQFMGWDPVTPTRTYLSDIVLDAPAGSNKLVLSTVAGIQQGMWVRTVLSDPGDGSLFQQVLFAGQRAPEAGLLGYKRAIRFVSRVASISSWESSITLERPLPMAISTNWMAQLHRFAPLTAGSGMQDLSIEFAWSQYPGHLQEPGYNAIHFNQIAHGFISNVRILNSDSGIYCWGCVFCTFQDLNVTTTSGVTRGDPSRVISRNWWLGYGFSGHRAVWLEMGGENVVQRFRVSPPMFHDLTVSDTTYGNVFRNGFGDDLCFDHHKTAPWGNLFTNIRTGKGTRPFFSGGASGRGPYNGGALNTWWAVRGDRAMVLPPINYAPALNFIGYWMGTNTSVGSNQEQRDAVQWVTQLTAEPSVVSPPDLYVTQLKQRKKSSSWNVQVVQATRRLMAARRLLVK